MDNFEQQFTEMIASLYPVKTQHELVRIGGFGDGGYLMPDDFQGIDACFSPGVGHTVAFELDLLEKYNVCAHLMDSTVIGVPGNYQPLSFTRKLLGAQDNSQYISLDTWVKQDSGNEFILQMDIEGGEFDVINGASIETLKKFRMMSIEVHRSEQWTTPEKFSQVQMFFKKLTDLFYVVHIHPNNCNPVDLDIAGLKVPRVFELTFIRKDRAQLQGYCTQFPHALDRKNVARNPDMVLSKDLYYSGE